jgi:hypothetical protein
VERGLGALVVVAALAGTGTAGAQDAPGAPDREQRLERRVAELEERLRRLEGVAPPTTAARPANEPVVPIGPGPAPKTPENESVSPETLASVLSILDKVRLTAVVDGAYIYNLNNPDPRRVDANLIRVDDPDHNTFELTWAKLGAGRGADTDKNDWDAGFRIEVAAGREVQKTLSLDPNFGFGSPINVAQAYAELQVPTPWNPVLLRAGRFYAWFGTESLDVPLNPNYSLSWLCQFTPFTTTGFSAGVDLGAGFRYVQYAVNGWDVVVDNNDSKTFGGQLAWTLKEPATSILLNWIFGPEKPDNNHDNRGLVELDAIFAPTEGTELRGSLQLGGEGGSNVHTGGTGYWGAAQIIFDQEFYEVRAHFRRFSIAVRGTYYNDNDGARTGVAQVLGEMTGTFAIHFSEHAKIRFELRQDLSTKNYFLGARHIPGTRQEEETVSVDGSLEF